MSGQGAGPGEDWAGRKPGRLCPDSWLVLGPLPPGPQTPLDPGPRSQGQRGAGVGGEEGHGQALSPLPWQERLTGAGDKRRTCGRPCAPLSGPALAGPGPRRKRSSPPAFLPPAATPRFTGAVQGPGGWRVGPGPWALDVVWVTRERLARSAGRREVTPPSDEETEPQAAGMGAQGATVRGPPPVHGACGEQAGGGGNDTGRGGGGHGTRLSQPHGTLRSPLF